MSNDELRNMIAKAIWEGGQNYPRLTGSKWEELAEYVESNPAQWEAARDRCLRQADAVIALGLIQVWQPIDTAPRDIPDIDLWVRYLDFGSRHVDCAWSEEGEYWFDMRGKITMPVTHWRLPPDPPNTDIPR